MEAKQAKAVTTTVAKKKMLLARAGEKPLPKIAQMAFGCGGANAQGEAMEPSEGQGSLKDELIRKDIEKHEAVSDTQVKYFCTLEEGELAGESISEIALVDAEGDLVAIKNCAPKVKDDDWKMTFIVSDTM